MGSLYKRAFKRINRVYGCFSVARHRFWFVDVPRTSSSSIRVELGSHYGRAYSKRKIFEKEYSGTQCFPDHMTAREMLACLGRSKWNSLFTFTMVRNPWDRIYSMYSYRRKICDIPNGWSFRDYVLALENCSLDDRLFKYHGYRYGASDYVLGEDGELIVDYVAKYENRSHDLKFIASRLNCPELGKLHIQSAAPESRHYSEFYDQETKEIIRRLYIKDVELFDYKFEDRS